MSDWSFTGFDTGGNTVPLAAFVEHPDRNRMRILAAPGYSLTLFQIAGRPLEVVVTGSEDTWRLAVRQPTEVETMSVTFPSPSVIEIAYGDIFSDR